MNERELPVGELHDYAAALVQVRRVCVCASVRARARACQRVGGRLGLGLRVKDTRSDSQADGPDVTVTSHTVSLREPKRLWALAMGMTRKIVPRERR